VFLQSGRVQMIAFNACVYHEVEFFWCHHDRMSRTIYNNRDSDHF